MEKLPYLPSKVEAEDSSKLSTFSVEFEEGIVSSGSGGLGWSILGSCVLGAKAVIGRKLSSFLLGMGGSGFLSRMWPGKLASTEIQKCRSKRTILCCKNILTLNFFAFILDAGLTSIGKVSGGCYRPVRYIFLLLFGDCVFIICHFTCTATHAVLSKTEKEVLWLPHERRPHHYCIPCESYFVRLKICLQPSFTSKL